MSGELPRGAGRPDHDIIIVGGGPAGVSAALFLAHLRPDLRSRMRVLEKERYPREKYCAGGIGGRAEMALGRIGVEVSVPSVPATTISVALPGGEMAARARHIGRVVRRIEFDSALAEVARRRGIRIDEGVRVSQVRPDPGGVTLETSEGALRARVVLGADGVGSVVRKSLGLGPGLWRAQVLEVDTPPTAADRPRDVLHFDLTDGQFSGYTWDFPTIVGGEPMVCRGVYHLILPGARASSEDLSKRLAAYLLRFGLDLSSCKRKRYAERGFAPAEPASAARVLLLGEAAGIDPITGEGIAQAILYGEAAAPYLLRRMDAGDLSFSDWKSTLGRTRLGLDMAIRHYLCRRFFGPARAAYEAALLESPEVLQMGVEYFGGLPIAPALSARVASRVVSQLVKRWGDRPLEPLAAG